MNFRCSLKFFVAAMVSAAICNSAGRALALDRDLAYLHALESPEHNYGDVAVSYLESLQNSNKLSPALREVYALEMSNALRAEAQNPPDPSQRGHLLKESQRYLDEFVKNNPNNPEILQAQIISAEMMFSHAQEEIAGARNIKDPAEKANALQQARGELTQVKAILQPSVDKLVAQSKALGPRPARMSRGHLELINPKDYTHPEKEKEAKREELEFDMIRVGGELAVVDYFVAHAYGDPVKDAAERKSALNTAAKALDNYYQLHRGDDPVTELGRSGFIGALVAHTWYGKAVEELNDRSQAKDVFDEVLENFPEAPDAQHPKVERTGLEPVLARAKYYSLQLLADDPKQQKEFLEQAQDFLTSYKKEFGGEWGYQATSLEVAKALLASADKETDVKKKTLATRQAIKILKAMSSVPSEFQRESTELLEHVSAGVNPTTVEEALAMIRIALDEKKWDQAEGLTHLALNLLNKQTKKDANYQDLMGKLQDTLATCQIQPLFEDFQKNREPFKAEKYQAWLEAAQKIAQDNKKSVIAPKAASFAVYCAAVLYGKARSDDQQARTPAAKKAAAAARAAASKQLQDTTDFILANFPNSAEADEARLSLGKAKWSDGHVGDAIAIFESINPKSEKYPEAMRLRGEMSVEQFQSELKKPAEKQNAQLTEKFRVEAVTALTESVKEQLSLLKPGDAIPTDLVKTQLLLAQVEMEGKEYAEAVKVLQPLIDAAYAARGTAGLDETMLKIFSAAVKAYMAMDDFQKAGKAGNVLIDLGPDKREVNVVLVGFVRRLDIELKELRDKLDKMADASPAETESLRARVASIKDMMGTMVSKLADRKELDAGTMVYLGSLFTDVDNFEGAKLQYGKVQDMPGAAPKLKLWVGAQLVDILGKEGQLEKATDEIAKLRKDKPNNLDFMVVEAKLWQEWGQKEPARYDTAVQKWTEIRRRLQHQRGTAAASIYYDSVYNSSFCYFMEANKLALNPGRKNDAIQKIKDGEKILNSELIPNAKSDPPDTVKRFKGLLTDLEKLLKRLQPAGEI